LCIAQKAKRVPKRRGSGKAFEFRDLSRSAGIGLSFLHAYELGSQYENGL
jgi:hypothetical protein